MALFKTNAELANYYPARMTLEMKDIASTMERVEFDYLQQQILGDQQYQELLTAYEADSITDPTSRLGKLLDLSRYVVSHLVAYHFADIGAVQLTSTGFIVATPQDGQGTAATNKVDRLKREVLSAGFSFMDRLLGFLNANSSDYPLWADSVLADRAKGLMRTTQQYNGALDIAGSHWLFWKLRPLIERHQNPDSLIARTLASAELYDELVSQSNAGDNFSNANAQLIRIIRPAIAHLTMAEAVTELSLNKDDRGVWTFQSLSGGSSAGGPVPASDRRLDTWQQYHAKRADEFIQALLAKLRKLAAAAQLPLYAATSEYSAFTSSPTSDERDPSSSVGNFM